jgi:ATPase subunit of ABC transporter with duplicated ATPase domains
MEGHETNGAVSESIKEFCMGSKGVTEKVKRAAGVKMKIDQEKARKQEEERRKKEEERRKKELELADRKRKREDADKREREEKRKRVEEMLKLKREQEERQRFDLDAKENRRRMLVCWVLREPANYSMCDSSNKI